MKQSTMLQLPKTKIVIRRSLLILIAITLAAAVLRLLWIHQIPPPAGHDEIWFSLTARRLIEHWEWRAFLEEGPPGGNVGPAYLTVLVRLLGFTSITSSRITTAVLGTLTVPATYFCIRELVEDVITEEHNRVALLAAFGTAVLSTAVAMSRVGMEPGMALLPAVLAIWLLARAIKRKTLASWVYAGVIAGLAQYVGLYAMFLLPVLAFMGLRALLSADADERKHTLLGGIVFMFGFAITAMPLIVFAVGHPARFFTRSEQVTRDVLRGEIHPLFALILNVLHVLKITFVKGQQNGFTGVSWLPMLDPLQSIGVVIGFGILVRSIRRSLGSQVLLVWLIMMITPTIFSATDAGVQRMIGVVPPIMGLAALGWSRLYDWLQQRLNPRAVMGLATVALSLSAAWNIYLTLVVWPQDPLLDETFATGNIHLTHTLIEQAKTEPVWLDVPWTPIMAFEYLLPGTAVKQVDFRECLPLANGLSTQSHYVVLTVNDLATVDRLQNYYPDASVASGSYYVSPLEWAIIVVIPPSATPQIEQPGDLAEFDPGMHLIGFNLPQAKASPGDTVSGMLYWEATGKIETDLTMFVHIGLGDSSTPLITQYDAVPCPKWYPTSKWQVGDVVAVPFTITIPADAAAGNYPIAVGWYDYPSLVRMTLRSSAQPLPDNLAAIGEMEIER